MLTCSIALCTKNRTTEVRQFLGSLSKQNRLPDEVLVIDGASNPIVKGIAEDKSPLKNIRYMVVQGDLTVARNLGIASFTSDVLFFLDDDLILKPDFIHLVMETFEADRAKELGGVCGTIVGYAATKGIRKLFNKIFFLPSDGNGRFRLSGAPTWVYSSEEKQYVHFLPGGLTAYRREVFNIGVFDAALPMFGFTDDVDFSCRVSRRYKNLYLPAAKAHHNRPESKRAMSFAILRTWIWAYWRTYWKNHRYQVWGYPALCLLSFGFFLRYVEANLSQLVHPSKF